MVSVINWVHTGIYPCMKGQHLHKLVFQLPMKLNLEDVDPKTIMSRVSWGQKKNYPWLTLVLTDVISFRLMLHFPEISVCASA